jgi:uncharacterized protein (TIGR02596 family)
MNAGTSQKRAFSLLELIIVILIIGIVAAFVTPAIGTVLKGSQLTQAEQIVTDQLKLARQQAVTRNRSIQVRFIRYGDPEVPGEVKTDPKTGAFRAIQLFEIFENGASAPLDKPQLLPQAIILDSGNGGTSGSLSTLINPTAGNPTIKANKTRSVTTETGGDPAMPRGIDWNYDFLAFRFLPDGSTDLNPNSGSTWYVTGHNVNDVVTGSAPTPPPNFFTIQVDPISGTLRIFRPSV